VYAKLFTSIYQGTLRGNSNGLLVFTNLIAHCDKEGVVDMHPRAIAEEVGLSVDQVKAALLELEAPDDESRSPEEQGRRIIRLDEHRAWGWRVVNYVKYRAIRNEDDRREQNRIAQAKWREKNKPASASVSRGKPQSAHTEAEADTEEDTPRKLGGRPPASLSVKALAAEGVDSRVAADWLTLRKAKKLPLTPTAWEGTKAEGAKAGLSPAETVAAAVANNWAGFKASWYAKEPSKVNGRRDIFAGLEK
jgi:hypothetical protein